MELVVVMVVNLHHARFPRGLYAAMIDSPRSGRGKFTVETMMVSLVW